MAEGISEPNGREPGAIGHEAGEQSGEEYRGYEVAITKLLDAAEIAAGGKDWAEEVGYYRAAVVVAVDADGREATRDSLIGHFLDEATNQPSPFWWKFDLLELAKDSMREHGTSTENAERYVDIEAQQGFLADRFAREVIGRDLTKGEILTAARVYTNGSSRSAGDEDRHMFKKTAEAQGHGDDVLSELDELFNERDQRWESSLI